MIFFIIKWGILALFFMGMGIILFKREKTPGLLILTYRKIGGPVYPYQDKREWTSVAKFTRTLDQLQKHGFTFISPRTTNLSSKSVLLVFLDGYRSFYQEIYPLLKSRQIPCTVCIPTGQIGQYNAWQDPHLEPWQDVLTAEELQTLAQDPLITLGAQPLNRQDVTLLPLEQARYEIEEGIFRLEKILGRTPALLALWPANGPVRLLDLIPKEFPGWIWTNESGINTRISKRLKTLWGNSFRARWLLWKMR